MVRTYFTITCGSGNLERLKVSLILLAVFCLVPSYCKHSRITFENGAYNNILIALNPDIPSDQCMNLIGAINSTFTETSNYLSDATGQRARFGANISILIPTEWDPSACASGGSGGSVISPADVNADYESADVKISSTHPIAASLPWAEQHQGCGKSAESIFIPPSFLTNTAFNEKEKGQILLHEWLKFRYGVFEEYGFYGDSMYSPCYEKGGQVHFTSCTKPSLSYLADSNSELTLEKCKQLVFNQTNNLKGQIMNSSSSIMFAVPIMGSSQIPELCSDASHNVFVNSKQNVQCNRKSASDTITSNADFKAAQSQLNEQIDPNFVNEFSAPNSNLPERISPQIQLVHHFNPQKQGYAFLIENSDEIRKYNRIHHVKQSIAEFISFINVNSEAKKVFLITYNGEFLSYPGSVSEPIEFSPDNSKQGFLRNFPDLDSPPLRSFFKDLSTNISSKTSYSTAPRSLHSVFSALHSKLENHGQWKWNIFLISSQPPNTLDNAIALLKTTPYSVSAITFDNSADWLKWNSIPQTRKVLYLPFCTDTSSSSCSARASSILTDHFLEVLGNQYPRRFFQKIVEVDVQNTGLTSFQVPSLDSNKVKTFFLTFLRYSVDTSVTVSSPITSCGSLVNLLNYNGVLVLNSDELEPCQYHGGSWQLNVSGIRAGMNTPHLLRVFVETTGGDDDVVVLPSLALDLSKELFPSAQNMMVPIHVAVKNKEDHPIVGATVDVDMIFSNSSGLFSTIIVLQDDGNDPDATKHDGVYSSFLYGYSTAPSYHTGSIRVRTSNARSIRSVNSELNKAALLDDRLNGKCCGSFVPEDTSSSVSVGPAFYSTPLPSFRTGENIPDSNAFPPSRIQAITKTDENNEFVQLKFTAPKSDFDGGTVNHYEICALKYNYEDFECMRIDLEGCHPVPAGMEQQCRIFKNRLRETFANTSIIASKASANSLSITCGIRGVNSANVNSSLSTHVLEISLFAGGVDPEPLRECESISDGCLPIYIFWILVGLLGALLLAIIIISACWCYRCSRRKSNGRRKENSNSASGTKRSTFDQKHEQRDEDIFQRSHKSRSKDFEEEFNNKGSYRNPEMDTHERRSSRPVSSFRKRSISAGDIHSTRFQPQTHDISAHSRSSFVDPNQNEADSDEMPVFFSNGSLSISGVGGKQGQGGRSSRIPDASNSSFKIPRSVAYQPQVQEHNDWNGRVDDNVAVQVRNSQYRRDKGRRDNDRNSRRTYGYADQMEPTTSFGVPSISSMVDMQMSNEDLKGHEPVYASVNRNGRRTLGSQGGPGSNRNSGIIPQPPGAAPVGLRNSQHAAYLHPSFNANPPKANSRPHSSQSLDSGFVRGQSPNSLPPPIRMDHFPSSESETYSEMSRADAHGNAVPPPPPMPSAVTLTSASSNRHDDNFDDRNGSRSMSKTPPRDSRFGVLAQMGPIPDRKSLLKPRQGPPPPPPPRSSVRKVDSKRSRFNSTPNPEVKFTNEGHVHGRDGIGSVDDDNDSDTWDVYDEFDFNPGVSHV